MKHLDIGGSTAARTLACPGWIKACKDLPKSPPGQAAIDGSMHHTVMEKTQQANKPPKDFLGLEYTEKGTKRVFGEDDLTLSEIAHTKTEALLDELDIDTMELESFVQIIPDVAGTSIDLLGLSHDEKVLLFLDYKFGRHKVKVEENAQLQFGGIATWTDPRTQDLFNKVERVEFVIVQPTLKGVVFRWSCDLTTLEDFGVTLDAAIKNALSDNPTLKAGEHCKYCPASPFCEAKRFKVSEALVLGARSKEHLQLAADVVEEVEDWVNAVKSELYVQIGRGVDVTGWKIVDKKGKRAFIDEADAEAQLIAHGAKKKDIVASKLMTAPQVDKALKKFKFKKLKTDKEEFTLASLIESKSSGTTLARADDDRDAVVPSAPENLKKLVEKDQTK
jgi:hypothetical protein